MEDVKRCWDRLRYSSTCITRFHVSLSGTGSRWPHLQRSPLCMVVESSLPRFPAWLETSRGGISSLGWQTSVPTKPLGGSNNPPKKIDLLTPLIFIAAIYPNCDYAIYFLKFVTLISCGHSELFINGKFKLMTCSKKHNTSRIFRFY